MNSSKKTNRYEIQDDVRRRLHFTDEQLNELCEAFAVVSRAEEETETETGREGEEAGGVGEVRGGGRGVGGRGGGKGRVMGHQVEMILNVCLAVHPTEEQMKEIIYQIDHSGSVEKSFDAMIRFLSERDLRSQPEVEFRDAFDLFDRDGDGFLTTKDLKQVMSNFGLKMTDGQIEEMVREADLDRDGKINYTEFERMMSLPPVK